MATPPPQHNFHDAHQRHWEDAKLLFANQRWPNASQLYGLSAECGLKAIMDKLGMAYEKNGKPEKPYDKHVNTLWTHYSAFVEGKNASHYSLVGIDNPFAQWDIAQRYRHRLDITQKLAQQHQEGAQQILAQVRQAKLDGLL